MFVLSFSWNGSYQIANWCTGTAANDPGIESSNTIVNTADSRNLVASTLKWIDSMHKNRHSIFFIRSKCKQLIRNDDMSSVKFCTETKIKTWYDIHIMTIHMAAMTPSNTHAHVVVVQVFFCGYTIIIFEYSVHFVYYCTRMCDDTKCVRKGKKGGRGHKGVAMMLMMMICTYCLTIIINITLRYIAMMCVICAHHKHSQISYWNAHIHFATIIAWSPIPRWQKKKK